MEKPWETQWEIHGKSMGNPWEILGKSMGTHGNPWVPMGSPGSHGSPWGPHGSPWVPMGPHRFPWVPMGTNGSSSLEFLSAARVARPLMANTQMVDFGRADLLNLVIGTIINQ